MIQFITCCVSIWKPLFLHGFGLLNPGGETNAKFNLCRRISRHEIDGAGGARMMGCNFGRQEWDTSGGQRLVGGRVVGGGPVGMTLANESGSGFM